MAWLPPEPELQTETPRSKIEFGVTVWTFVSNFPPCPPKLTHIRRYNNQPTPSNHHTHQSTTITTHDAIAFFSEFKGWATLLKMEELASMATVQVRTWGRPLRHLWCPPWARSQEAVSNWRAFEVLHRLKSKVSRWWCLCNFRRGLKSLLGLMMPSSRISIAWLAHLFGWLLL